jgi:D-alanyl-lipoteichoic acid acyltransferase DltB (MBOAT superfamily)
MVNFNLPYFATNPQDFWRRWHISLSTWLRDYLYISLGGNRKGEARTYFNLMVTMVLGGLWHGASWTFVLWGFYHGALLCGHRAMQRFVPEFVPTTKTGEFAWRWLRIAFMFLLTLGGWLIFRAKDFHQLAAMTQALFHLSVNQRALAIVAKVLLYSLILLLVQLLQFRKGNLNAPRETPVLVQAALYLVCFYLIVFFGKFDAQSFIYFQF